MRILLKHLIYETKHSQTGVYCNIIRNNCNLSNILGIMSLIHKINTRVMGMGVGKVIYKYLYCDKGV